MTASEIILYHYTYSPYARRIAWYLALRGIPYSQCLQPSLLPRPDVARIGLSYRLIPILAIGKDVYLDTRLQLSKLEAMYPELPRLGASAPDQKIVERLLPSLTMDAGLFRQGVSLFPTDLPLLNDPRYFKDRGDFLGVDLSKESMARDRPQGLNEFAAAFELLETTLLADGREWVLKTEKPTLADIEAVWPLHWISGTPRTLPQEMFSPATYPKVYAYIKRFQEAVSAAKKRNEKPKTLSGEEAAIAIESSAWHEREDEVDVRDPLAVAEGLKKGDEVALSPTDTGKAHKDVGKLMSLNRDEVVIEVKTEKGEALRVHVPRHGFRVQKTEGKIAMKL